MYTTFNFEATMKKGDKTTTIKKWYNSKYDMPIRFIELCESITKAIKAAEKQDSFKFELYATDGDKPGNLWTCSEGNKEDGFYFTPYEGNDNPYADFVITKTNPFEALREISPFSTLYT